MSSQKDSIVLQDSAIAGFLERFEAMTLLLSAIEIVGITFLVLIVVEFLWDFATGRRRKFAEPLSNLSFQVVTIFLQKTAYGLVAIAGFAWLEPFALLDIPLEPWSWVLCLLATDMTYYWMHRAEHRVRILWALHSVHHSSEEYDLSTSLRIFWFIDFTIVLFFVPLVLIGFSGPQVLACMLIVFTYMIWVHTEKIGKLGWFDRIFSSPSVHRVHHGNNEQYIDKNYAGILVIWDRMFGTYEPEVEKVRYGIVTPVGSSNPIRIGVHEITRLVRDLRQRRGWVNRLRTLFNPPAWKPADDPGNGSKI